jgi:hypothetical protein
MLFFILLLLGFIIPTSYAQENRNMNSDNTINAMKGTIQQLSSGSEWYVIIPDDEKNQRYAPSNLPDEFKKDGLRVIFSGKVAEIPPNVRMIGIPLELVKVENLE